MSLPSRGLRGLIGNAAAGYRVAAEHPRPLLAVLLPILAPVLFGLAVLDMLLGRDHTMIIDGLSVIDDLGDETSAWAELGLTAAFWLLALPAATLVAAGAERGHTVRPTKAVVAALRHLPVLAIGMCAAIGGAVLLLWVAAGLAGSFGDGLLGLGVIVGALAVTAVVAVRVLISLLIGHLGRPGWELTRGRVASTAGAFLLGGVAVPLLLAYLGGEIRAAVSVPVVGQVIDAAVLIGLIAAQAGILANLCLLPSDVTRSDDQDSADLAAVDARLAELSGKPMPVPWLAVTATVAVFAVLAPAGIAAANPFGAPTVRSHSDAPGDVAAIAWPAGQHPVIATIDGARFCDNDVCDRYVAHSGGVVVMDGRGSASISADGATVVSAALTGGQDNGGPFINYGRCTRAGCSQEWLPTRASAKEPFGWPELAVAVAPDEAVWFVLAMPSADDKPAEATYRITFIRCAQVDCAKPQRFDGGTVQRIVDGGTGDQQLARLTIGADGRPLAIIRTGVEAVLVTCAPVTCAAPTSTWAFAGEFSPAWTAPTTPAEPVVTFRPDAVRIGEQIVPLFSTKVPSWSGALAVAGGRVYATAAEAVTSQKQGLHITVGAPAEPEHPERWRQVLWRCEQSHCERQALDSFDTIFGREALAVSADGRVLVVRTDRVLLVSAPAAT